MDTGGGGVTAIQTAVWAAASRTLTTGGAAVVGSTVQPPAQSAAFNFNATGTTVALNFSGAAGVLLLVAFNCTVSFGTGLMTAQLEIVIDGVQTTWVLYNNAQTWDPKFQSIANMISGTGGVAGNVANWALPVQFNNSLVVRFNITSTTASAGAGQLTVQYAHS